ncbi:helix-turn-helix domain-containing protein [Thermobispora bispora]|uniref:helix-turn-helix domain-containing protein n=1 Tax=Thermobispora bispora TaxID=2006 RepID=UPI001F11CB9A|nr:helix-turn-helix domain-containing protein [Thermobispora bispora]
MEQVAELYRQGYSCQQIASMDGRSAQWISVMLQRAGVPRRHPGGRSSLPEEVREQILDAYKRGEPVPDICARFGVSYTLVYAVADQGGVLRRRGAPRRVDRDQIMRLHEQGWTADAIAVMVGCSAGHVRRVIRERRRSAA